MMKTFPTFALAATFALSVFALAPLAHAAPTYDYEWKGTLTDNGAAGVYTSPGIYPTSAACYASLSSATDNNYSPPRPLVVPDPPQFTCTCDEAIYLQPGCPDYAAANTANDNGGGIPQGGACQHGNDNQCAQNLICGNSNTCIPGNLPDGSACTEDDQCVSQNGCSNNGTCGSPSNVTGGNTGGNTGGLTGSKTGGGSTNPTGSVSLLNPLSSGTSLPGLLTEILGFVTQIGTVIIILMVVYVGFKFVMAQGDPGALAEARQALLWTVVGALILLGANAIALAIQATASAL